MLGAVEIGPGDAAVVVNPDLLRDGKFDPSQLRTVVEKQRGMKDAFASLESNPAATPTELGDALRERHRADWAPETTKSIGKYIRGWARACGIETELRPPSNQAKDQVQEEGLTLFEAGFNESTATP